VLLRGPLKAREVYKHFGKAPGTPGSRQKPYGTLFFAVALNVCLCTTSLFLFWSVSFCALSLDVWPTCAQAGSFHRHRDSPELTLAVCVCSSCQQQAQGPQIRAGAWQEEVPWLPCLIFLDILQYFLGKHVCVFVWRFFSRWCCGVALQMA
jgi:hypothetical protein